MAASFTEFLTYLDTKFSQLDNMDQALKVMVESAKENKQILDALSAHTVQIQGFKDQVAEINSNMEDLGKDVSALSDSIVEIKKDIELSKQNYLDLQEFLETRATKDRSLSIE